MVSQGRHLTIIHSHLRLVEQQWANRIKSYVNDQATPENLTLEGRKSVRTDLPKQEG